MIDENLILVLQYLEEYTLVEKFDWFRRWREGVSRYRYKFESGNVINLKKYRNLRVFDCSFTDITTHQNYRRG